MRTATLARRVRLGTLVALLASAWTVVSAARSPLQIASPPSSITVERAMAAIEAAQQPNRQGWDPFTLAEMMDRLHVPGLGIAVIWNGQVHWARGYGVADVTTGAPVTPTTLFQAASISKPVAAMATMRAVQSGALTLDTDINDLLTTWRLPSGPFTADRPVTPRALLSHTSGLGDGFGFPGYSPTEERPSVLQILEGRPPSNVGRLFMERPPMTAFKYSGGMATYPQQHIPLAVYALMLADGTQNPTFCIGWKAFPSQQQNLFFTPFIEPGIATSDFCVWAHTSSPVPFVASQLSRDFLTNNFSQTVPVSFALPSLL